MAAARHVVLPLGIVSTGWPAVRDKCRDLGIRFQHWQDGAGRCILAKREDGLYAAGIGSVVISIPRQVGKTFLIGAIVFALCLLHPGLLVLWTSHRMKTSKETFRSMQGMARRRKIKPFIAERGIHTGSGEERIEFRNGSRILFGARADGFGRGIPGVSLIVFDEAQILDEDAMDDMVPAANQALNPLVILTGTPPKPTDNGDVFSRLRAKALAGESENTLYIEFSADADTDPIKWAKGFIDWVQVAKANPSFPRWTPRAAILRMLELLGLASFRLEGLGIWNDITGTPPTIGKDLWANLKTADPPTTGPVVVGVKFSLDGKSVAVCAARKPAGGKSHLEVLAQRPMADGLGWLVVWLAANWRKLAAVAIDGKAGRDLLLAELIKAKVPKRLILLLTTDQVITAHAMTLAAVQDSTVTHANQPGLNASVASSAQRKIGLAGGWGWEPIGEGDVLPLEAATLALWAVTTSKRSGTGSVPKRIY